MNELRGAIEAILFVADEPLSAKHIASLINTEPDEVIEAIGAIVADLKAEQRGWQIREVSGGFKLFTHPRFAEVIEAYVTSPGFRRLTRAALEVLAIVAYRQPVTRAVINDIRGVSSDSVLISLMDKELIDEAGHEDGPGQAILYKTTSLFLEKFGLKSIDELPGIEEFAVDDQTTAQIREKLATKDETDTNPFKVLVD